MKTIWEIPEAPAPAPALARLNCHEMERATGITSLPRELASSILLYIIFEPRNREFSIDLSPVCLVLKEDE